MSTTPLTVQDFAARIRAKYPGAYDSLPDQELAQRVVAKHPEYQGKVSLPAPRSQQEMMQESKQKWGIPANAPAPPELNDIEGQDIGRQFAKLLPSVSGTGSALARTFGLPGSSEEWKAKTSEYEQAPVASAIKAANPLPVMQGLANIPVSMGKEWWRGTKGAFTGDENAPLHAAASMNPFAAPVVSQMTEQGLGTKQAAETGAGNVLALMVPGAAKEARTAGNVVFRGAETRAAAREVMHDYMTRAVMQPAQSELKAALINTTKTTGEAAGGQAAVNARMRAANPDLFLPDIGKDHPISKLLNAKTGKEFVDALRNEETASELDRSLRDLSKAGGLNPEFRQQLLKASERPYDFVTSGGGRNWRGVFSSIMNHPVLGTAGYGIAKAAKLPLVGRMIASSELANIGETIEAKSLASDLQRRMPPEKPTGFLSAAPKPTVSDADMVSVGRSLGLRAEEAKARAAEAISQFPNNEKAAIDYMIGRKSEAPQTVKPVSGGASTAPAIQEKPAEPLRSAQPPEEKAKQVSTVQEYATKRTRSNLAKNQRQMASVKSPPGNVPAPTTPPAGGGAVSGLKLGKPSPKAGAPDVTTYPVQDASGKTIAKVNVDQEGNSTYVPEGYRPGDPAPSIPQADKIRFARQIRAELGLKRLFGDASQERVAGREARREASKAEKVRQAREVAGSVPPVSGGAPPAAPLKNPWAEDMRDAPAYKNEPQLFAQRYGTGDVWYHGTTEQFSEFKTQGIKRGTSDWNSQLGTHFAANRGVAEDFAGGRYSGGKNGRVIEARLNIQNPATFNLEADLGDAALKYAMDNKLVSLEEARARIHDFDPRHSYGDGNSIIKSLSKSRQAEIANGFREYLQAQGHDGIVYGNSVEGHFGNKAAIAFDPQQISQLNPESAATKAEQLKKARKK